MFVDGFNIIVNATTKRFNDYLHCPRNWIVNHCECISAELNDLIAFVIKENKILILKNNAKLFF